MLYEINATIAIFWYLYDICMAFVLFIMPIKMKTIEILEIVPNPFAFCQ